MALPRGIRNNNPLNIRKGNNWKGERPNQTDKEFEEFESMQMGLRAAFILLRNYMNGYNGRRKQCDTIEKIVSRWAPEVENATRAYIRYVSDKTGIHERQILYFNNKDQMCRIVQAMAYVENGVTLDMDEIKSAYDMV